MKNRTYFKATLREITRSLGRFIAIVLIILLGTLLYVGIKTTQPVLDRSADAYVRKQDLSDLQIISTGGLTAKDEMLVEQVKDAKVETGHQLYHADAEKNEVSQWFSYDPTTKQNKLVLKKGHLPKNEREIVLDTKAQEYGYRLGDSYKLEEDQLKRQDYTIVGFVDSPIFISSQDRGYTNVGNGTVDFFGYLPTKNFKSEIKSIMYVRFDDLKAETYSDAYKDQLAEKQEKAAQQLENRPEERLTELKYDAEEKLAPERQKVADGLAALAEGEEQLNEAQTQIDQQRQQLESLPEAQKAVAERQLQPAQARLDTQHQALAENKQQLTEAEKKINDSQQKIADLKKPVYRFDARADNIAFQEYGNLSGRIAAIADVFPVFFFFIAALITFTTMTRMVEENRREIGILKALGYRKREIANKYIVYSLLAAAIGIILGVLIGTHFLARFIFEMCRQRYNFTDAVVFYDWPAILQATGAFLLASLGSAMLVLLKELREKPSELLLPKAPKAGKRIFLERVTPLWSRLSFNQKVSYRNLFRYKARMLMTIIGIAGCTGLMLAGFGLKDSLGSVGAKQFGPIIDYQAVVTLDDEVSPEAQQKVETEIEAVSETKQLLPSKNETVELRKDGKAAQSLTLVVPEDTKVFKDFIHLRDQKEQGIPLNEKGAVITQKMAEYFGIAAGDTITLYDEDQQPMKVKISAIAMNYLGGFVYMTKDVYEQTTGTTFNPNTLLVKSSKLTDAAENRLSEQLLATGDVVNTTFMSKQIEEQDESMSNLNSVVIILVTLSGLLAFVVLYNLTNINISERVRELSTIKVLGFFDKEVTMYIVRENIIFTLLGILGGFGIGYVLTQFILDKASMENLVFPLVIKPEAYLYSGGLTILFTIIVMIVTHFKLKHINMIDALKSNE